METEEFAFVPSGPASPAEIAAAEGRPPIEEQEWHGKAAFDLHEALEHLGKGHYRAALAAAGDAVNRIAEGADVTGGAWY